MKYGSSLRNLRKRRKREKLRVRIKKKKKGKRRECDVCGLIQSNTVN